MQKFDLYSEQAGSGAWYNNVEMEWVLPPNAPASVRIYIGDATVDIEVVEVATLDKSPRENVVASCLRILGLDGERLPLILEFYAPGAAPKDMTEVAEPYPTC